MPVTRSQSGKESSSEATRTSATRTTTDSGTDASATTEGTSATGTDSQVTESVKDSPQPAPKSAAAAAPVPEPPVKKPPPVKEKTLRAASQRSTGSRRRLAQELEAKQRLAEIKLKQLEVAAEIEEIRLERLRAESSDEEECEEERELVTQRVDMWFERQQQQMLAIEQPSIKLPPPPPPPRAATPRAAIQRLEEDEQGVCAAPPVPGQRAPGAQGKAPVRTSTNIDVAALTAAITEAARSSSKQSSRYMHELPIFSGNSSEWLTFKAMFKETQDNCTPAENVARLRKCLKGAALEAVTALLITHTGPGAIMQALERRFGRPDALVLAEMEKIKTLPRVSDNPRELCIFANRVANIVATVEVLQKPQYLHSPEMLRCTIDKLTPILKNKWYDYAALRMEDQPELKTLSNFLSDEADKCAAYAPIEDVEKTPRRRAEKTFVVEHRTSKNENKCPACSKEDHRLPECPQFIKADTNNRWEIAKKSRMCFRCLRANHRRTACRAPVCGENECQMRHHKLLHHEKKPEVTYQAEVKQEVLTCANTSDSAHTHKHAYLKIAQVTLSGPKGSCDTFALLDEGSTATIIDAELAQLIGLEGPVEPMKIQGVNGTQSAHDKSQRVSVTIRGRHEQQEHTLRDAHTVKKMNFFTQHVRTYDLRDCDHLEEIKEKLVYEDAEPQILIGQDNWELIISRQVRSGSRSQPVASHTLLGWVLHGYRAAATYSAVFCSHLTLPEERTNDLEQLMKNYFELESLNIAPRTQDSDPEKQALEILNRTSRRQPDGSFITGLLWRNEITSIPNNYEDTLRRLRSLERKLDRDADLKNKYNERIENLLKSNYAELATAPPTGGRTWYLPHFAVINPDKKKIRVVHDAAAKSQGRSLNDMLLQGPDLLQSLPGVIMKFRQYPIAVSADIKEMFMQVKIIEEDRDALRFLWRGERRDNEPPDEYRMTSLIFGATSSPCTALYVKNTNAQEHEQQYPAAARAIQKNHYMDDYLQSFETTEDARDITTAVDFVHKRANFHLTGWTSNQQSAIQHLKSENQSPDGATVEIGGNTMEKTLGLLWHVQEDTLGFRVNTKRVPLEVIEGRRVPTKREALSVIMSIFDPLGLISPVTTTAKRIMQDTWKYKTSWDDEIPTELQNKWDVWLLQLRDLPLLRVPRCYDYESATRRELHTFVDASEEAYAAVVYLRATRGDGSVNISIAAAKSRVTPTKLVSIPRLELQAAVLGARLAHSVETGHDWPILRKTYWSDSRTALTWIRSEPRTYKAFVAHRLAEIEDLTKKNEWRWVPTAHNTADDATRATPTDFNSKHRWFTGPEFLYQDEQHWPTEKKSEVLKTGEEREKCTTTAAAITSPPPIIEFERFSSWIRLVRTIGRVLQFVALCKKPHKIAAARRKRTLKRPEQDEDWRRKPRAPTQVQKQTPVGTKNRKYIALEATFMSSAERLLIREAQKCIWTAHENNRTTFAGANKNDLSELKLITDEHGIKRLYGRINEASDISFETANPAVLDGRHIYTRLYIKYEHERLHHGGVEMVVNELRQRVWIPRIRPTVKNVLKSCLPCRIRRAKPACPSTGNLPAARLAHNARPFTHTGLDYLGPLEVTVGRHREKRYVALFTCMTSRAVHLEVVASLSTDAAINAIRRFIARRGCPTELWSDNATCFRAADRELTEAWKDLEHEVTERGISWRFLPPSAPFMAGAWERMVRTVKEALKVTLHEQHPSDETLTTLLAEVEATVNSRPLTHVAVTPDDPPALTPNMILIGPNSHVPIPGTFEESDVNARAHWRRAQRLADIFWRRWIKEYLPLLQHRREPRATGDSPAVGDIVVICDSNLPRNIWPRGRVTAVYPGKDGEVRVVDVTTSNGNVLRRPTKKIVVLPGRSQAATAGECTRHI